MTEPEVPRRKPKAARGATGELFPETLSEQQVMDGALAEVLFHADSCRVIKILTGDGLSFFTKGTPWVVNGHTLLRGGNLYVFYDKTNGKRHLAFINARRPARYPCHIRDNKGASITPNELFMAAANPGISPHVLAIMGKLRDDAKDHPGLRHNLHECFDPRSPRVRRNHTRVETKVFTQKAEEGDPVPLRPSEKPADGPSGPSPGGK